jgi:predicted dienelactone hydrolase
MAALTAACGREAPVAPGQYVSPQPYSAGIFDGYVVTGELSGRELPVKVRYPEGAEGPLPVAIFSHGAGALNNGHETYQEWGTRLAEAGYAVVHIAHVEGGTASHCAPLQILPEECRPLLLFTGDTLGAVWFNRPRDVTAVIDELDAIGAATGIELDMGRIALVGHSGGAHTVMSSAGAAIDFSPSVTGATYLDPRIRAFVALSPQGPGSLGFTDTSWDNMAAPMLIATGAADTGPTVDDPAMRRVPFQRMSGPGVYELFIDSPGRRAQRVRAE